MSRQTKDTIRQLALRFINSTSTPVFLTGRAGTGKTTFLKQLVEQTHKKAMVAAPTGIAAINAGGVTLHSLFQLPFGSFVPSDEGLFMQEIRTQVNSPRSLLKNLRLHESKRRMLRELELLIIDEVSMLRADLLDAIDLTLRHIRRKPSMAFGGVQMLFIGDLLQLPPVVKPDEWSLLSRHYASLYFFEAHALRQRPPVYLEFETIYRQSDPAFIRLLNQLRDNSLDDEGRRFLNQRIRKNRDTDQTEGAVYLTTHNHKADAINRRAMDKLPGRSHFFDAEISGDFSESMHPLEARLELKEGAQVMFIKNDYSGQQRYFNGKIGTISSLGDEDITVSFDDGSEPAGVEPYTWENKKFSLNPQNSEIEEKVVGKFTQLPLRPAWAITIHKSQGLSFDKAIIDVSEVFAPGQLYVALSRLRSLEGLMLSEPLPRNAPPPEAGLIAFSRQKTDTGLLQLQLENESHIYIQDQLLNSFDLGDLAEALKRHMYTYNKEEGRSPKMAHRDWARQLQTDSLELKKVADRFLGELRRKLQGNELNHIAARLDAARQHFEPRLRELSQRIFDLSASIKGKSGLKSFLRELSELEGLYFSILQRIARSQALIRITLNGQEPSRENMTERALLDERAERALKGLHKAKNSAGRKQSDSHKAPKKASAMVSCEMFLQGICAEDIAQQRSLAGSTIASHLAEGIARGMIDVNRLLDKEKLAQIMLASEAVKSRQPARIMAVLGDEFSWEDVRYALASRQSENMDMSPAD